MQYNSLRGEFDALCGMCEGVSGVLALSRLLFIFYQQSRDQERLVSAPLMTVPHFALALMVYISLQIRLCQKWLQFRKALATEACSNTVCAFHLRRVLNKCCLTLHAHPSQPLALPLRMMEVFLDKGNYPESHRHTITIYLGSYLINCGECNTRTF